MRCACSMCMSLCHGFVCARHTHSHARRHNRKNSLRLKSSFFRSSGGTRASCGDLIVPPYHRIMHAVFLSL